MQPRVATFGILVMASVLHLPVAYQVVRDSGSMASASVASALAMGVGLIGMGLAWSAGCALEQRRAGSVRVLVSVGVLEGALAFLPTLALNLGERVLLVAAALLALVALVRIFAIDRTENERA